MKDKDNIKEDVLDNDEIKANKKNNIIIVILVAVLISCITGTVFAYIYFNNKDNQDTQTEITTAAEWSEKYDADDFNSDTIQQYEDHTLKSITLK